MMVESWSWELEKKNEFLAKSPWPTNHVGEEEAEENLLLQVMAATQEELSPLNFNDVATYFN